MFYFSVFWSVKKGKHLCFCKFPLTAIRPSSCSWCEAVIPSSVPILWQLWAITWLGESLKVQPCFTRGTQKKSTPLTQELSFPVEEFSQTGCYRLSHLAPRWWKTTKTMRHWTCVRRFLTRYCLLIVQRFFPHFPNWGQKLSCAVNDDLLFTNCFDLISQSGLQPCLVQPLGIQVWK